MPGKREKTDWSGRVFGDVTPIDDLYAECGPGCRPVILHKCPTCHVDEGDFCCNAITHKTRKVPCNKRLKLAGI